MNAKENMLEMLREVIRKVTERPKMITDVFVNHYIEELFEKDGGVPKEINGVRIRIDPYMPKEVIYVRWSDNTLEPVKIEYVNGERND